MKTISFNKILEEELKDSEVAYYYELENKRLAAEVQQAHEEQHK